MLLEAGDDDLILLLFFSFGLWGWIFNVFFGGRWG